MNESTCVYTLGIVIMTVTRLIVKNFHFRIKIKDPPRYISILSAGRPSYSASKWQMIIEQWPTETESAGECVRNTSIRRDEREREGEWMQEGGREGKREGECIVCWNISRVLDALSLRGLHLVHPLYDSKPPRCGDGCYNVIRSLPILGVILLPYVLLHFRINNLIRTTAYLKIHRAFYRHQTNFSSLTTQYQINVRPEYPRLVMITLIWFAINCLKSKIKKKKKKKEKE